MACTTVNNTHHVLLFFFSSLSLTRLEIPQWWEPILEPSDMRWSLIKGGLYNTCKVNEWMSLKLQTWLRKWRRHYHSCCGKSLPHCEILLFSKAPTHMAFWICNLQFPDAFTIYLTKEGRWGLLPKNLSKKGLRHIVTTDLFISSCLPFLERTSGTLTLNWYQKSHFFPTVFGLVLSVINYNFATEILWFSMCLWRFLRVVSWLLLHVHRKKKVEGFGGKEWVSVRKG